MRRVERSLHLIKGVEHHSQSVSGDAAAIVADAHYGIVAISASLHRYCTVARCVFSGVMQHIGKYLHQSRDIAIDNNWWVGIHHRELMATSIHDWLNGLDRTRNHAAQIDRPPAQFDLAACDACYVHKIVKQSSQLSHLARHHNAQLLHFGRIVCPRDGHSCRALLIGDRGLRSSCERIARNTSFR